MFYPIGLAMYVKLHDHCVLTLNVCDRQISFNFGKWKCAHTNNMKTVEYIIVLCLGWCGLPYCYSLRVIAYQPPQKLLTRPGYGAPCPYNSINNTIKRFKKNVIGSLGHYQN